MLNFSNTPKQDLSIQRNQPFDSRREKNLKRNDDIMGSLLKHDPLSQSNMVFRSFKDKSIPTSKKPAKE